jgi:hypothetical protein
MTIAFRAKQLASENMATSAFRDANRALRNLQSGTAGERALLKFQQSQRIIELALELLQRTIELAEELQITTYILNTKQREDLNQQQEGGHLKLLKRHKELQQQLKTAEKQQRHLQGQVGINKDNQRKHQIAIQLDDQHQDKT